jgi:hypothetical protein
VGKMVFGGSSGVLMLGESGGDMAPVDVSDSRAIRGQ